ncbi:MAG TPA: hypothetical protein VLE96_06550 [Chlamydiales bacterium]|nr:hypothetical protein [Chlamydiales bacterium]
MRTLAIVVALSLAFLAHWRTSFSPDVIAAPMFSVCEEASFPIDQNYSFLGKGRQSFAFLSADGKTVLKFFNKDYFQMPWYSFALPDKEAELKKRQLRKKYFSEGYLIAEKFLSQQTGLLYVHYGQTKKLPKVKVKDQANRTFIIDLNYVPFVLQKKGDPICSSLQLIYETKGKEALLIAIDEYLEILHLRISLGIADGDHDIKHNYGFLEGKPFHLDPGRLYFRDLADLNSLRHEWWVGTHQLRKWLNQQYPNIVPEEKWNPSF